MKLVYHGLVRGRIGNRVRNRGVRETVPKFWSKALKCPCPKNTISGLCPSSSLAERYLVAPLVPLSLRPKAFYSSASVWDPPAALCYEGSNALLFSRNDEKQWMGLRSARLRAKRWYWLPQAAGMRAFSTYRKENRVHIYYLLVISYVMKKRFIHLDWDNTSTWWKKVYTFGLG